MGGGERRIRGGGKDGEEGRMGKRKGWGRGKHVCVLRSYLKLGVTVNFNL